MQSVIDWLPWFEESDYQTPERITKQGAYALLARLALYAGGYSLRWNLETNDPATLKMARRDDATRVKELYQIADNACFQIINHGSNSLVQAHEDMSGSNIYGTITAKEISQPPIQKYYGKQHNMVT